MKFDKETIIVIVLCILFLIAWPHIVKKFSPPPAPPQNIPSTATSQDAVKPEVTDKTSVAADGTESPEKAPAEKVKPEIEPVIEKIVPIDPDVIKLDPVSLENEYIFATIDPNKGNISSIVMKKYFTTDKVTYKKTDINIVLIENVKGGALGITPEKSIWTLTAVDLKTENKDTPEETLIVKRDFKTASGQLFAVTQKWSIKQNYIINNIIEVTNFSETSLTLKDIVISAGGIQKITELGGDKVFREDHEIDYYSVEEDKIVSEIAERGTGFWAMISGDAGNKPKEGFTKTAGAKAKWIGVVNKYFACLLVPEKPFDKGVIERAVVLKNEEEKEYVMGEVDAVLDFTEIAPGQSQSMSFKYYAGPKKMKMLQLFEPDTSGVMKLYILGMSFLQPLSKGMLYVLMWLKDWCGSYGLSIILLTLVVKTLFWPVTHRANISMRKMQKIQPLIKELKKKNKDNPQQVNAEMMKLYKEHKVNPLGGCLPILLQMPVFFALYATLSSSIAPRHTSFLWMTDLSMPDTVAHIFSLPINPLMLMMTGTMVLQQKLTPSAADPAQQKMMMFMPLIMLVMLYSLPSGLTLYWTVSQFISIAQLIVNKQLEKRAELKEAGA